MKLSGALLGFSLVLVGTASARAPSISLRASRDVSESVAVRVSTSGVDAQQPAPPAPLPDVARSRKDRPGGPTRAAEKAVIDGLRWLVRHQNPDGSWSAAQLKERCAKETPCFDAKDDFSDRYDPGLTGLALLCFLRAGFTPESKQDIVDTAFAQRHSTGAVVKSGLQCLRRVQNADGSFSKGKSFIYNDAIATLAVVEAYATTHDASWREPAQHGVEFLQSAQRKSSKGDSSWGWRYASRVEVEVELHNAGIGPGPESARALSDSDTSATAWCAAALRAAREAGLEVKDEALAGAFAFTRAATASDGFVGYRSAQDSGARASGGDGRFADHPAALSAMGICTRIDCAHDPSDPFFDLAAKRLMADLPSVSADNRSVDACYWYFGSSALWELDGPTSPRKSGKYWNTWSNAVAKAIMSLQDESEKSCRSGGWIERDRWSSFGGPIYSTAMSILTLETHWRVDDPFDVRPAPQATSVGAKALDLRTRDWYGQELHFSELAGRVVVLDFLDIRALESKEDIAARAALLTRLAGKPLVLINIGFDPKLGGPIPGAVNDHPGTWRWFHVSSFKNPLFRSYAVDDLPTTIVIDAEGVIRGRHSSWIESVELIEKLVAETERENSKK